MDFGTVLGAIIGIILIILAIKMRGLLTNVGLAILGLYGVIYSFSGNGIGWFIAGALAIALGVFNTINMIKNKEVFLPMPDFGNGSPGECISSQDSNNIEPKENSDESRQLGLLEFDWSSSNLDGDHWGFVKALKEKSPACLSSSDKLYWVAKAMIDKQPNYLSSSEDIPLNLFVESLVTGNPSYAHGDLHGMAKALIERNHIYAPGDLQNLARAIIENNESLV